MNRREFFKSGTLLGTLFALTGLSCNAQKAVVSKSDKLPFEKIVKTDAEWKKILTTEQYQITRKAGTERPYTSPMTDLKDKGIFTCVCCDLPLFNSENKFDSGTGWASFYAPFEKINILEKVDNSLWETRTEVLCNRCDAHLGHVFDDGPKPTGLRYCINGVALRFVKK
jgi:methionine-R-sulfoxide reductase